MFTPFIQKIRKWKNKKVEISNSTLASSITSLTLTPSRGQNVEAASKSHSSILSAIGGKDKCPGDKLEHSAADDTTEDEEEDDEELVEKIQPGVNNSQEHISSTSKYLLLY